MGQIRSSRNGLLIYGKTYNRGDAIPESALSKLPPQRLDKLLDQRQVSEDRISVSSKKGR